MGCPDIPNVLIVPRFFSRLEQSRDEQNEPRPLADFFAEPALVILGEPGMGKSTSFIQAAREEANAECLTIRQFIPPRNPVGLQGKTLYLDGLDEQRAGRANGNDVLDAIIGRLQDLDRPKFRISCRTADWFGELDKSNLRDAVFSKTVTVIRLEPLTTAQIQEIVAARGLDGEAFLEQARQSGIEAWLTNPQHLELVLSVVSRGQSWPTTRKELFERACSGLVREHNEIHRRAKNDSAPDPLILDAGLLCALILRADLEGVAIEEANADEGFLALSRFPGSSLPLVEAARTKLFRHPLPECATYYHRTMAEYLAARFLVDQMAKGLPAERVRILLTTDHGRVPSSLRGLHAWVATLCPEPVRSMFLRTDPMGLVMFGDPASLSSSRKGDLLEAIAELARENPWFRDRPWDGHSLGYLADSNLKDRFEALLADWRNQTEHLLYTVLDIVCWGKERVVSQEALWAFLYERDVPSHLRVRAVEGFASHYSEAIHDLEAVLTDLDVHPIVDNDQALRAVLLKALYPSFLTPQQVMDFLPSPKFRLVGVYFMFLAYDLVASTSEECLPSLMGVLAQNKHRLNPSHNDFFAWQSLMGQALIRGLKVYGEHVETTILYAWLDLGVDEFGYSRLKKKGYNAHALQVIEWMNCHTNIVKLMFLLWIQRNNILEPNKEILFWEKLQQLPVPEWFPDWCLELAATYSDLDVSHALFHIAIHYLLRQSPEPPYPLDRAFAFIEQYPRFGSILDDLLCYKLSDNEWKNRQYQAQSVAERDQEKSEMIDDLSERIAGIRDGTDLEALFYLGQIYQESFIERNSDLPPRERLQEETSAEIAQAAEEGFVQCLTTQWLPTPQDIGVLSLDKKEYEISYIVLSAINMISVHPEKNIQLIQESVLSSAIAFQLSGFYGSKSPAWFDELVLSRPELVSEACQAFWLPQLRAGKEHVSGLHVLAQEALWSNVAKKIVLSLLEECPHLNGQNLYNLLLAALKWGDHQELLGLARVILDCRNDHVLVEWKGIAFLLDQAIWPILLPGFEQNGDGQVKLIFFIVELLFGHSFGCSKMIYNINLSLNATVSLIVYYGERWDYTPITIVNDQIVIEGIMSECIYILINNLSGNTSPKVIHELQRLAENNQLQSWRNPLRLALFNHRQMMADNHFKPLAWDAVFNVLKGGPPATVRDLHALVVDHIRTIAKEWRDSRTDGYRMFWNTNGHHKTTNPKSEDNSRDRLLEALQYKLAPLPDIHVEPEGRYADDKRADIKVLFKNWNVPIEIKQDYHPELWNAATKQLIAHYVRNPGTEGYGIYLVFWYGAHSKGLKPPPNEIGIATPLTHAELEQALQKTIPDHDRIQVIVLDVSTHKPCIPKL